jgi:hypothetical protein
MLADAYQQACGILSAMSVDHRLFRETDIEDFAQTLEQEIRL